MRLHHVQTTKLDDETYREKNKKNSFPFLRFSQRPKTLGNNCTQLRLETDFFGKTERDKKIYLSFLLHQIVSIPIQFC